MTPTHLEIVIVRHGQSTGNRDRVFTGHNDSPLTERGHKEALATARRVAAHPVDELISSDLLRAVQTASPIADFSRAKVTQDPLLRERSFGQLTGRSFADIEAKDPVMWAAIMKRDPFFRPPEGESNLDCRERVGGFLDALFARRKEGRVVLVSHGMAINHMLYHLLKFHPNEPPPVVFHIENCSLQRAEKRSDGTLRITCVNDKSHLSDV